MCPNYHTITFVSCTTFPLSLPLATLGDLNSTRMEIKAICIWPTFEKVRQHYAIWDMFYYGLLFQQLAGNDTGNSHLCHHIFVQRAACKSSVKSQDTQILYVQRMSYTIQLTFVSRGIFHPSTEWWGRMYWLYWPTCSLDGWLTGYNYWWKLLFNNMASPCVCDINKLSQSVVPQ